MITLLRADATPESGTGHVMRCAALGLRLKRRGAQLHFASASPPSALSAWLGERGFVVHPLTGIASGDGQADLAQCQAVARQLGGVDLLVVDHYGLGLDWEKGMRPVARRILAIDDLADRDHDCDVLLDQNLRYDAEHRYTGRIPSNARQFIGPRFALLRPEFDDPSLVRTRDGKVERVLVFFGGTDPGNQSLKVVDALSLLGASAPTATIVLGPAHPDRALVHSAAAGMPSVTIVDATNEMGRLMQQADLALGACGIAAWERCLLGLPSIVVVTAENQREDAEILRDLGALDYLGDAAEVTASDWTDALTNAMASPERMKKMGVEALQVMRGRVDGFAELESVLAA